MSKQKIDIAEVKVYKCSDGSTFDDYDKAVSYETELKTIKEYPDLALQRITELESRVLLLELEVKMLKDISIVNPWLPKHPHPDIGPIHQPFNPTTPTPKLPAQPGDVLYEDTKNYQRVVMGEDGEMKIVHTAEDDERAFADGKTVVYAGYNRVVMDKPLTEPKISNFTTKN